MSLEILFTSLNTVKSITSHSHIFVFAILKTAQVSEIKWTLLFTV